MSTTYRDSDGKTTATKSWSSTDDGGAASSSENSTPDGDKPVKDKPVKKDISEASRNNQTQGKIKPLLPPTPLFLPNGKLNPEAYNCHSYVWENSQGDPRDPKTNPFLPKWDNDPLNNTQNYHKLQFNGPNQVGDRVIYFNDDGKGNVVPTYSAIVTGVDKDGFASQVTSK